MPKDSIRFAMSVQDVFSEDVLEKANSDISKHPKIDGNRSNVHTLDTKSGYPYFYSFEPVTFDERGHLDDWSQLRKIHLSSSTKSIDALAKEAIEKMSVMVSWKNQTISMNINILLYVLSEQFPNVTNMPWHQDPNTLTMTTVFTPHQQNELGFSGGDLCFAAGDRNKTFNYGLRKTGFEYSNHREDTIQSYTYPYNGGFIFDNIGTCHKVSDIHPNNPKSIKSFVAERRLFTIFANPNIEEVEEIALNHSSDNLFKNVK